MSERKSSKKSGALDSLKTSKPESFPPDHQKRSTFLNRNKAQREPRITGPILKVLFALISSRAELSGADIMRETKLASGTLYPILIRLEAVGWLQSRWEQEEPSKIGRPRKRLYVLTSTGRRKTQEAYREIEPAFWRLRWT